MIRPPASDFWKAGLVRAPISAVARPGGLSALRSEILWLPDAGPWRYLADPFGVCRDGIVHVFVEAYDYRTKHAVIERHELGADGIWRGGDVALAASVHLSYPYLVESDGEVYMVPESHRAREVVLYRARRFPHDWTREAALLSGVPVAEPSLTRHKGRWWMFFTLVGAEKRDQRELHAAYASALTGPWQLHPGNPIALDRAGARPGGTPFVDSDGCLTLPVQDCTGTYGGALTFRRFTILNEREARSEVVGPRLTGDLVSSTHAEGLHTLSACGTMTLLDVKRVVRSWARTALDWRRRLKRII